ncbi:MAG: DUF2851 family protein [Melioribacteraceae bacterium]|jgi:hypothetical protein|nr:DUF2851 family protein [Melioribacteraceae bacterium]
MSSEIKIPENLLYEVWQKQNYKSPLKTESGEEISILDSGFRNNDLAGPDFKNARIRIGNLTFVGDIEIDCNYTDWKSHGHNIDNKYNSIILHAALHNKNNQSYVYTRNGRKVHSICLSHFIEKDLFENLKYNLAETSEEEYSKLKCSGSSVPISLEVKQKFLSQLGMERFHKKCKRIYERLKELQFLDELNIKEPVIAYDLTPQFHEKKFKHSDFSNKELWQQLFYELVFEALGYSKNKVQMTELSQTANINFLKKIEKDGIIVDKYEAFLLYISGLIKPSDKISHQDSKEYIERILLNWNTIKPFYDGKYMEESHWHFFRLRPQNFPTIRIAAGARILKEIMYGSLINIIAKKISEIHNLTVLINSLRSLFVIKSDGFWKNHYVIDQSSNGEIKYFVGATRADEIVVNVVLPFFAVYFEIFGNQNVTKKILKVYSIYEQRSENLIVTDVGKSLNMTEQFKKTIIAQGMIDLFRNFCSKNKCLECEIGKTIFN